METPIFASPIKPTIELLTAEQVYERIVLFTHNFQNCYQSLVDYSPFLPQREMNLDQCELLCIASKWDFAYLRAKCLSPSLESLDEFFKSAGLISLLSYNNNNNNNNNINNSANTCTICWEDDIPLIPLSNCKHRFCASCLSAHLHNKLCIDGEFSLRCPASKCLARMSLSLVTALADCPTQYIDSPPSNPTSTSNSTPTSSSSSTSTSTSAPSVLTCEEHLRRHLIADYASNSRLFLCPRCDLYVQFGEEAAVIVCPCGLEFCPDCLQRGANFEDHRPVTCAQRLQWENSQSDLEDSQSMRQIYEVTRPCPWEGCGYRQERHQGCQHVQCGRPTGGKRIEGIGCGRDWCWHCGRKAGRKPDEVGDFCQYQCNKDWQNQFQDRLSKEKEKLVLLMFFDRWHSVTSDIKSNSASILGMADKKCEELVGNSLQLVHLDDPQNQVVLRKLAKVEIEMKKLLANTYILSYFIPQDLPQRSVFDGFQGILEECSDSITKLNRTPLIELDPAKMRFELLRAEKNIEGMRNNLVSLVAFIQSNENSSSTASSS